MVGDHKIENSSGTNLDGHRELILKSPQYAMAIDSLALDLDENSNRGWKLK